MVALDGFSAHSIITSLDRCWNIPQKRRNIFTLFIAQTLEIQQITLAINLQLL